MKTDSTPSISLSGTLDGVTLYEYDGFNRQTKVQTDTTVAEYTYKPNGLRRSKTVNGQTTTHIWDGSIVVAKVCG